MFLTLRLFTRTLGMDWSQKQERKHFIRIIDNFAFLAYSANTLDQFCAQIKLGNTISSSQSVMDRLLPQYREKVHEREWQDRQVQTTVNLEGIQLVSKKIRKTLIDTKSVSTDNNSIQLPGKGEISAYLNIAKSNRTLVINNESERLLYQNEEVVSNEILSSGIIGKPISFGSSFIFSSKNALHRLNPEGKSFEGFPIQLEFNNVGPHTFRRRKRNKYCCAHVGRKNGHLLS